VGGKKSPLPVRDANMFSKRVVNIWNSLSDIVVSAPSINSFKSRLSSVFFCNALCILSCDVNAWFNIFLFVGCQ